MVAKPAAKKAAGKKAAKKVSPPEDESSDSSDESEIDPSEPVTNKLFGKLLAALSSKKSEAASSTRMKATAAPSFSGSVPVPELAFQKYDAWSEANPTLTGKGAQVFSELTGEAFQLIRTSTTAEQRAQDSEYEDIDGQRVQTQQSGYQVIIDLLKESFDKQKATRGFERFLALIECRRNGRSFGS